MNRNRLQTALLLLLVFGLLGTPAPAEVGVSLPPTGSHANSYLEEGIVDDPEPVGNSWKRHHPDSPTRVVLNEEGYLNNDGPPSFLVANGVPIVAWSRNSPSGYDVVISRFVDGAWTTPTLVADTAADELDPYLILDPIDGSIHVVYWVADAAPRVLHKRGPADLSSWSPAELVSQPGEIALRPSGAFHEGQLHVAYELHDLGLDTTPRQIVIATDQGPVFTAQMLAVTLYAGENRPGIHCANGKLWVDWIDADGEMAWSRELPSGDWTSVQIETYASPEELDYHVRGSIRMQALD